MLGRRQNQLFLAVLMLCAFSASPSAHGAPNPADLVVLIVDAGTGSAISGVRVRVVDSADKEIAHGVTGPNGKYSVGGLSASRISVVYGKDGWKGDAERRPRQGHMTLVPGLNPLEGDLVSVKASETYYRALAVRLGAKARTSPLLPDTFWKAEWERISGLPDDRAKHFIAGELIRSQPPGLSAIDEQLDRYRGTRVIGRMEVPE